MAIPLSKLRSNKLGLRDKIPYGLLEGCVVFSVVEDYHEYLMWLQQKTGMFNSEVMSAVKQHVKTLSDREYEEDEVAPWYLDDVPF